MNVFVTGGSRGIGKAIVEKFAQEGHQVIFTYSNAKECAIELGEKYSNIEYYQCNVEDALRCDEVASKVLEKYINIDVLVNNVGITKDKTFINMDKETWDTVIDINLKSLYYFTHPFIKKMVERKEGRIINISSVVGLKGAFGKTNYAASKAGILGFTKALALEVAAKNITVNAIAPGMIETDIIKDIPKCYLEEIRTSIPQKKFGMPKDVAEMVYYLAGETGQYITGQVMNINGGMYI